MHMYTYIRPRIVIVATCYPISLPITYGKSPDVVDLLSRDLPLFCSHQNSWDGKWM